MSSNQIVVQEVRHAIEKMAPQFKAALPAHVSTEKFVRVTLTAVQMNPALLDADRRTLFAAATRAAQMGLLPDGREGAIVTFGNNAQWMPMVAGIMKLVRNSGEISTWSVQAVYKNDNFDFSLGDEEHISHKPALSNRGELIAVYSIVTMKDGEKSREVMSVEDVNAIRARSRSGKSGPWVSDFAEMAKKTVIRRHSKRLPLSTDIEGVLKDDDDLFMPPAEAQTAPEAQETPATPKRASRLQKVAEQAPSVDDDGVIDVEHRTPEQAPESQAVRDARTARDENHEDSPI